jgi:hypothetical protein
MRVQGSGPYEFTNSNKTYKVKQIEDNKPFRFTQTEPMDIINTVLSIASFAKLIL